MKQIKFFILIFLLLSACGYTPIYKNFNDVNFEIEITNLSGDRYINNRIKNDINRYKISTKSNKKIYKINIDSDYEKTSIAKNLAGDDTSYELKVITVVNVSSEIFNDQIIFTEKFNMDNINDDFEEREYEETIKDNFAKSISRKLISRISQFE
tara:strand:- start:354 stop:815 length:462 start_codon:yes stop_codon:yes gene_type:complete